MVDTKQILKEYWGFSDFRPMQAEVINSVLQGNDTLALLPTGGGKSICFQVPALATEGICLVVSPLIALMKDQVSQLQKRRIMAAALISGMSAREVDRILDNCTYGNHKFLYLSPERLGSEAIADRLRNLPVNLIAVDEAHCISEWGHDFRPSYLKIAAIRTLFPKVPILALTASATSKAVEDIQKQLLFENGRVFQHSFERQNLAYVCLLEEGKLARTTDILNKVKGSSIVYVRSRVATGRISEYLGREGISALSYHAGLSSKERTERQAKWMQNKARVMVSTSAFGMGIDKPDVRLVIHYDLPESPEAYFQEAGRAGRDGKRSYAVLLYNASDKLNLMKRLKQSLPELRNIQNTYQGLSNVFQLAVGSGLDESYDFDLMSFCKTYNMAPLTVAASLKILEQEEWIILNEAVFMPSRIRITANREDLYKLEVAHRNFEQLIKLLLRAYPGIFEQYVNVQETQIAAKLGLSVKTLIKSLRRLQQMNVLEYEAQKDKPQITFTRARAGVKDLTLDKKKLKARNQHLKSRIDAMIHYVSSESVCRSQLLLAYFGQEQADRCGICDVCLSMNKLDLSDRDYNQIRREVKAELRHKPLPLPNLLKRIVNVREDKVVETIRWLKDHGKVQENEKKELIWQSDSYLR